MNDKINQDTDATIKETPSVDKESTTESNETVKEWYVLFGISGKCLDSAYVKKLYDAKKVTFRGPYAKTDIIKLSSNNMIKANTIIYKKGELEWVPFEKWSDYFNESTETAVTDGQMKEWYVLSGMTGKILEVSYVKDLYDANKIKIRGPYCRDDIVKYYNSNTINNETIVYKQGDAEWKPVANQKIPGIKEIIKSSIFDNAKKTSNSKIHNKAYSKSAIFVAALIALCSAYVAGSYYYYTPNNIYERIKKSVVLINSYDVNNNQSSLGSGFVIDQSGIILTNLHVIARSANIRVKTGDSKTYDIEEVVYIDSKNDLALLKVKKDKTRFTTVVKGDSNDIDVGDKVYTIGNPVGLEFSLSEGIVSGKRDEDPIDKKPRELIQITAPVSPGNSGGPVLDKKGRVIGVTTLGSGGGLQNLNFAVPIKFIADAGSYKNIAYKLLPQNPKWTKLATVGNNTLQNPQNPENNIDIHEGYYEQDTVIKYEDGKRRLWVKLLMSYRPKYNNPYTNGAYSNSLAPSTPITWYSLLELDCKNQQFRINVFIGTNNNKTISNANFADDNEWKDMDDDDKIDFAGICL